MSSRHKQSASDWLRDDFKARGILPPDPEPKPEKRKRMRLDVLAEQEERVRQWIARGRTFEPAQVPDGDEVKP